MAVVGVVGSIITDLAVFTSRLPARGENILARRLQVGPGGKGANAAAACARLGAEAILVGRVGDDDFGRQELAALRREGVDIDGVGVDPEEQTGTAVILVDDEGENTILVVIGANDRLRPDHVTAALASRWARLDVLLVNFEIPPETVATTLAAAREHGVTTVVDAGPPRPWGPEVWAHANIISPNELELETLVGRALRDRDEAIAAARELLDCGPEAIVLKRGAEGAIIVSRDAVQPIPGFRVRPVDTTGAGDAFSAALVVALAEGRSLPEAVRWANAAGAITVTRPGTLPAMPTRSEVESFLVRGGEG